ncbi:MAG: tripartite tricarboxylate transporter substrate-binding protein [Acuticoccus sp.]
MTKINRRTVLVGGAALAGSTMLARPALAAYPERPITVAMTAPPGGATDRGTRPIVELMKNELGARRITLQDMSGAGGIQALDYVLGQPADGYTWLGANDVIESFPSLGKIDFDSSAFDFWMSGGTACGVCVKTDTGADIKDFGDWIQLVRDNPGKYSVSTTPSGSLWSNVAVFLRDALDLDFTIANYKGGGPSVRAVMAGETDFGCMGVTPQVNFIKSGDLKCLAATVPTDWKTAGTTIPSMTHWVDDPIFKKTLPWTNIHGIGLKKGCPQDVLSAMDTAFAAAMKSPEMEKIYEDNGFFPFRANRDEANALMADRTALQAYIVEVVLGAAVKTRDELGIPKIEN